MTGRRGRSCKLLLDDVKEMRRKWKLKEEALDHTLWVTRFGIGYEPGVRQTTEWMTSVIEEPEDGDNIFLQTVGINRQDYILSHPRRSYSEHRLPWGLHVLWSLHIFTWDTDRVEQVCCVHHICAHTSGVSNSNGSIP